MHSESKRPHIHPQFETIQPQHLNWKYESKPNFVCVQALHACRQQIVGHNKITTMHTQTHRFKSCICNYLCMCVCVCCTYIYICGVSRLFDIHSCTPKPSILFIPIWITCPFAFPFNWQLSIVQHFRIIRLQLKTKTHTHTQTHTNLKSNIRAINPTCGDTSYFSCEFGQIYAHCFMWCASKLFNGLKHFESYEFHSKIHR